jgi:hypothetical protein
MPCKMHLMRYPILIICHREQIPIISTTVDWLVHQELMIQCCLGQHHGDDLILISIYLGQCKTICTGVANTG